MTDEEEAILASAPGGSMLPEHETRTEAPHTDTTKSTTSKELSPEQLAQRQRDEDLLGEQSTLEQRRLNDITRPTAQIGSDTASAALTAAQNAERQKMQMLPELDRQVQQRRDYLDKAQQRLDATPAPQFFKSGDTYHNVLKGVGGALAAIGDAAQKAAAVRVGHAPPAINTVADIINRDLDQQREDISKMKDSVVTARTGVQDAIQARQLMLSEVDLKAAATYDKLAKLSTARLAALGVKGADIESNQHVLDLKEKSEEHRRKVTDQMYTDLTKGVHNIGATSSTTDRTGKVNPNALPKVMTDDLSGKDLPIDPARTDRQKHNKAAAALPNINSAIGMLDDVLKVAEAGPQAPEWASYFGVDTSKQSGQTGRMTRFRSAYAAAKGESVGQENAHELANAIPDPPSNIGSALGSNIGSARWNNWKKKIEDTRQELLDMRRNQLANAGVPPALINSSSARPTTRSSTESNPPVTPSEPGNVATPKPTQPPPFVPDNARGEAIKLIKRGTVPGARPLLMQKYGITEADLQ